MQQNKTLGFLKKRILDALDENASRLDGEILADGNIDLLQKRMPDCISAALCRMYESLPMPLEKAVMRLNAPKVVCFCANLDAGEESVAEFEEANNKISVIFGYFGSGTLRFFNENGDVLQEVVLENTNGELEYVRQVFDFDDKAKRAVFSKGIYIKDFTVYENDGSLLEEFIPPYGYSSFKLPRDFEKLERVFLENGKNIKLPQVVVLKTAGYIKTVDNSCVFLEYKKAPPVIDETTQDSFVFDLDGCGFEALVCLAASELCRADDAGAYSRLLYKYLDLSESLYTNKPGSALRNSFYCPDKRKRW